MRSRWVFESDLWNRATAVSARSEGEGPALTCAGRGGRGPADQGNRRRQGPRAQRPEQIATRERRAGFPLVDSRVADLCHGSDLLACWSLADSRLRRTTDDRPTARLSGIEMDVTTVNRTRAENRPSVQAQANRPGRPGVNSSDDAIGRRQTHCPGRTVGASLRARTRVALGRSRHSATSAPSRPALRGAESSMATFVLTDVAHDVWVESFAIDATALGLPADGPVVGEASAGCSGGRRDGVDLIEVNNGALSVLDRADAGHGALERALTRAIAWAGTRRSPTGPVNPAFVNLAAAGGLGWLDGFDELLARCGLAGNGAPFEVKTMKADGSESNTTFGLHGKIANIPASYVAVHVGDAAAARDRRRGARRGSRISSGRRSG